MSQVDKLLELLSDGQPHPTTEILRVVYNLSGEEKGIARIASRVTDLRDRGYVIESRRGLKNKTVWWYKLMSVPEKKAERRKIVDLEMYIVDGKRRYRPVYDKISTLAA